MNIITTTLIVLILLCQYVFYFVATADTSIGKEIKIGVVFTKYDEVNLAALETAVARSKKFYNLVLNKYTISNADSYKVREIACSMIEDNIAAIIGPEAPVAHNIVQTIASLVKIPQFQIFPNLQTTHFSNDEPEMPVQSFNIFPGIMTVSKAIATLVKESRWKTFLILYEDESGIVKMQDVFKSWKLNNLPIMLKKLGPGNDHRQLLKEIKNSRQYNIIIDCKTENIMPLLYQAQEVKLIEEYHSFILTSLDTHTLELRHLRHPLSNITTLKMVQNNSQVGNVVKDWNLEVSKQNPNNGLLTPTSIRLQSALIYDAMNIFLTNFWKLETYEDADINVENLNCSERPVTDYSANISNALQIPFHGGILPGPLTGPITFDKMGQRTNFELQIMELRPHGFIETGIWSSGKPNAINFTVATQEEREKIIEAQIQEKVFRVFSRIGEPYFMIKETKDLKMVLTGNNRFEGYVVDLIDEIANYLNFTYVFEKVADNEYGKYDPKTKEWNGLIRQILDRKADLAICDLSITYDRRKAVDFSLPFMTLGISILYTKAVKEPPALFSFLQPLSLDVWLYMATSYLIVTIIIILVARLSQKDWENPHPCKDDPEELENTWDIRNCLWLTLGSIMAQGCDILPKGIYTRMVTSMWWFFSLIMIASYTANLTAFLTMERMGPTIESAEDLVKQTKIKYGCVEGGATASFFKYSNFTTYHRMWTQMQNAEPSVFEKGNEAGVQRVLRSKRMYAFIMESSNIEYQIERHCDLIQVGSKMDTKGYGIAMPFNSPYRTKINQAILKMQERGVLHSLKEKWWKQERGGGKCKESKHADDESASELGLSHVGGAFIVLIGGVAIAMIIAIFEFLWNVRKLAVRGKMSPKEAFNLELQFAMNFRVRQKAIQLK